MFLQSIQVSTENFPNRGDYPFNLPVLGAPTRLTFTAPVTFFVGENGSGKSTLLEGIARGCGIHLWTQPKRHAAHHNPLATTLWKHISVGWVDGPVPGGFFSAEGFAEFTDFLDDVAVVDPGQLQYLSGSILNTKSHGEGAMSFFQHRYRSRGLYFLDEPEAALSPSSQVQLLRLLLALQVQGRAQFIIATHSPILLALPGAQILSFEGPRITETRYEDTAHYRIYRQFLNDPSAFLPQTRTSSLKPA